MPMLSEQVLQETPASGVTPLINLVRRVDAIRLSGTPRTLLLDEAALLGPGDTIPAALAAKIEYLYRHESMAIVVDAPPEAHIWSAAALVPGVVSAERALCASNEPVLAIFGASRPAVTSPFSWYVGRGNAPADMSPCRMYGAAGTDLILGLYGTGLVQERAGAAFRAVGRGEELPDEFPYDIEAILGGLRVAVAPLAVVPSNPPAVALIGELPRVTDVFNRVFQAVELVTASSGAIAAAPRPSTEGDPDYWFFWPRDAGHVVSALAHVLVAGGLGSGAAHRIRAVLSGYSRFVGQIATGASRPGDLTVSRFTVDGIPIQGYGNPQNDGPAHTVLALLADGTVEDPAVALALAEPYLRVLAELAYDNVTFDPWEFAVGRVFSTEYLIRRALRRGEQVATHLGNHMLADKCGDAAAHVERGLLDFRDHERGYLRSGRDFALPWLETISGLDAGLIGGILADYDVTDEVMNVDDPWVQRTMQALEESFTGRWPANRQWATAGGLGAGIGRFPEDTNDGLGSTGGNPWVVTTLWAAQYQYRLVQRLRYRSSSADGSHSYADIVCKGDGYLQYVLAHLDLDALSEQIDGTTGLPRGAARMSWVHAELLRTLVIRDAVSAGARDV